MDKPLLGAAFALMAAFSWAFAVILFKRCGEKVSPLALNLFKNVAALVLLTLTLVAMGQGFGEISGYAASDIWILFLSGFWVGHSGFAPWAGGARQGVRNGAREETLIVVHRGPIGAPPHIAFASTAADRLSGYAPRDST